MRTAVAALIAVAIAWRLGLEHPQWAGMTVWSASLPVRGQLLEKSGYRLVGTVVGTVFGVGLVAYSHGNAAVLVAGLVLWIGLCVGAGNAVRGFLSYGTILAGYSAAMVALLDTPHPEQVFALGFDRFLTVAVGVLVALAIGWIFADRTQESGLALRVRRITARLLAELVSSLRGGATGSGDNHRAILSELADIDDVLEPHAAGSIKARRSIRAIRLLISAEVSVILRLKNGEIQSNTRLAEALEAFGSAIDAHRSPEDLLAALHDVEAAATTQSLTDLIDAIRIYIVDLPGEEASRASPLLPVLHRDWVGASQAGIRAASAMLAVGLLWLVTGWSIGPFMMLGVSVMASVFSPADNPAYIVRFVFIGQIIGACSAIALRWLAWPHAGGELELVAMMLPFMLVGPFLQSHRSTALMGFDYNMVLLLLSHPALPLAGTFGQSLAMAAAVVTGPLIAFIAYRLVFPTDLKRRRDTLVSMMVRELETMAGTAGVARHRDVWLARLNHRVLRLVRWSDKIGSGEMAEAEGGLAVLAVGNAILHMDELLREPGLAESAQRVVIAVLRRLKSLQHAPERAGRVLEIAAARITSEPAAQPELFRVAARYLAENAEFFRLR
nr:FUSC family protein [Rhizobium setariae]